MLIDVPIFALVPCFLIEGACFFLLCACSIFLSLRLHYAYWSMVLASLSFVLALSSYPCACTMPIDRRCLLLSPLRLLYLPILAPALCLLIEGACFFLPCACSIFLSLRLHHTLNGSIFPVLLQRVQCHFFMSSVFQLLNRHLGGLPNTLTKCLFTWIWFLI